eukprot:5080378-Amphidinium_carterae.2
MRFHARSPPNPKPSNHTQAIPSIVPTKGLYAESAHLTEVEEKAVHVERTLDAGYSDLLVARSAAGTQYKAPALYHSS